MALRCIPFQHVQPVSAHADELAPFMSCVAGLMPAIQQAMIPMRLPSTHACEEFKDAFQVSGPTLAEASPCKDRVDLIWPYLIMENVPPWATMVSPVINAAAPVVGPGTSVIFIWPGHTAVVTWPAVPLKPGVSQQP